LALLLRRLTSAKNSMFKIELTHNVNDLLAQSDLWNSLARGVPFRETHWLGPWWRTFGCDHQAYILVAKDTQGSTRGILPLYRSANAVLSMMGDGNVCSDDVSVLAEASDAVTIAGQMGEFLAETANDSRNGWQIIDIDGVVEGDAPMSALARGLHEGGAKLHTQSRMHVWSRPVAATWDDHVSGHGKTQRRKMRKWSKRIGSDGIEKQVAETEDDLHRLLDALIEMHQRRWTEAGESGSYADVKFRQFIAETAREFLSCGRLYLTTLKHEGKFIGAELDFIGENGVLYCYSSGYDLDASDLEPGRIICVDTLQELYRRNLEGINYMRGDEPYKARMASDSPRLFRLKAVAPSLLPRLRHAAWCTQFELRQLARRGIGRPMIDVVDMTLPNLSE
jgi:CelD/BcsL family acetyltransferase involved in cellulose biosynthesis